MTSIQITDDGELILVRVPHGRSKDVIITEMDDDEDNDEIEEIYITPYDIEEE